MNKRDDKLIVTCPGCRKKFRIKKSIRFQCKYCSALIDPDINLDTNPLKETQKTRIPKSLMETKEELIGSATHRKKKINLKWLTKKNYFIKRLIYWYESFISSGPMAMFITLLFLFIFTWFTSILLHLITGSNSGIGSLLWRGFLQICDPGALEGAGKSDLIGKIISILTVLMGIIIFSLVIAFLTNIFDQKLQDLKKGHSHVMEEGHTLILGWHDKVISIIEELIIANENGKKQVIVILSTKPKEELEDYLRITLKNRLRTKIIVRSGEISNIANLNKVAISKCQSIIIVSEQSKLLSKSEIALNDTQSIKAILSICKNPTRRPEPFNIITEIGEPKNISIAKSIGEDEVSVFNSGEIIAKILVQTSRQNGLATIYNELLSFAGHEIYCVNEPKTHGLTFREIIYDFPSCIPIGLKQQGQLAVINPPLNTVVYPNDNIILIAEDESAIYHRKCSVKATSFKLPDQKPEKNIIEKQLLLGWNSKTESLIKEYGDYLKKGSKIDLVLPEIPDEIKNIVENMKKQYPGIHFGLFKKDYRLQEQLEEIKPFTYDNIIILASELDNRKNLEEIESQTIYTLLLLRDMQKKVKKGKNTKLITELLDPENQELIQIAKVNDFIISNQLISMMLAQVSKQKIMHEVYRDLFRAEGSEIYLKPAKFYFERLPVEVSFYDIMGVVMQRNEVPFGYRINRWEQKADLNFGIKLNPDKQKKILLERNDQIIVVAEDEF